MAEEAITMGEVLPTTICTIIIMEVAEESAVVGIEASAQIINSTIQLPHLPRLPFPPVNQIVCREAPSKIDYFEVGVRLVAKQMLLLPLPHRLRLRSLPPPRVMTL